MCLIFLETYDQGGLQAVQLEDGTTAYIQHMPPSNTILAIQADGTVADLQTEGTIDAETISVLEQYSTKVKIMSLILFSYYLLCEFIWFSSPIMMEINVKWNAKPIYTCIYTLCPVYDVSYVNLYHIKVHVSLEEVLSVCVQMEATECSTGLFGRGDSDGVHMQVLSLLILFSAFIK